MASSGTSTCSSMRTRQSGSVIAAGSTLPAGGSGVAVVRDDAQPGPREPLHLVRRGARRDDDRPAPADESQRLGDSEAVVPGRGGDDAALERRGGEREHLVERAAQLEGAGALQVL